MLTRATLIAAIVMVPLLSACSSDSSAGGGDGPPVAGVVAVNSGMGYPNATTPDGGLMSGHAKAAECVGAGQAGDAQPGALVTIYGASNDIVGTAKLAVGHMVTQGASEFCVMPFSSTLNKSSDAYQVEFGNYGKKTVDSTGLGDVSITIP